MQVAILFLIMGVSYNHIIKKDNIQWFQALYYLSTFFDLFGSHTTSFLLAGAITACQVVTQGLGFSGYSTISCQNRFLLSWVFQDLCC